MRSPKVSVVIPTYDRSRFLREALQSALEQTFTDLEVIVVDDGSTDDTPDVVASFQDDARLRYIRRPHCGRGAPTRNAGIRHSRGELIALLDDDDLWLPSKLERQIAALAAEPRAGAVWCAVYKDHLGPDGEVRAREVHRYCPERYRELLTGPFLQAPGSTLLVRAACFARVGLFDERLRFSDLDMAQRLGAVYPFVYLDEPLAVYRLHGGSLSVDTDAITREWWRFMAKLRRRLPRDRHHLIPVVLLIRNGGWILEHLRAGRLRKASALALRSLGVAARHPLALPRALSSYVERRLLMRWQRRPSRRLVSVAYVSDAQLPTRDPGFEANR